MKLITFITVCLLACLADNIMIAPANESKGHQCRWSQCPYKGVTTAPGEWNESVCAYTECEEGSDCYYIDMLHLQFPEKEYEELEDLLFKIDKESGDDASVFNDNLEQAKQ